MDFSNDLLIWNLPDNELRQSKENITYPLQFKSFLGCTEKGLEHEGYYFQINPCLEAVQYPEQLPVLTYTSVYKENGSVVPFSMMQENGDLCLWYDPYRSKIIAVYPKFDFTFLEDAIFLFHNIADIAETLEDFAVSLTDIDVSQFYITVSPADVPGTFQVTIAKDKKENTQFTKDIQADSLKKLLSQIKSSIMSLLKDAVTILNEKYHEFEEKEHCL